MGFSGDGSSRSECQNDQNECQNVSQHPMLMSIGSVLVLLGFDPHPCQADSKSGTAPAVQLAHPTNWVNYSLAPPKFSHLRPLLTCAPLDSLTPQTTHLRPPPDSLAPPGLPQCHHLTSTSLFKLSPPLAFHNAII